MLETTAMLTFWLADQNELAMNKSGSAALSFLLMNSLMGRGDPSVIGSFARELTLRFFIWADDSNIEPMVFELLKDFLGKS